MGQMQTKILTAIRERAEAAGLEWIDQPYCTNVGVVYMMRGLESLLSFGYDFQAGYAILQFFPQGKGVVRTCRGYTHPDCVLYVHLRYEDLGGKMREVYGLLDSRLAKAGVPAATPAPAPEEMWVRMCVDPKTHELTWLSVDGTWGPLDDRTKCHTPSDCRRGSLLAHGTWVPLTVARQMVAENKGGA